MDSSDQWVCLARIERSRGRTGEVLAGATASGPEVFDGRTVTMFDAAGVSRTAKVEHAWLHGNRLVLKFAGVDSISDAERLRGLQVCIPRSERPPAEEGEFYFSDLIGCLMVDDATGAPVGEVTGWSETGAAALLEVAGANGEVLVPFVRQYLAEVDLPGRRIRVRLPDGLLDLNA